MRRFWGLGVLVILALLLTGVGQAKADLFDFTVTGDGISGSGELTATSNGNGTYTATDVSGIFNGDAISLIANPNAPSYSNTADFWVPGFGEYYITYDNQLYPSSNPLIDNNGLLFASADNPYINIFSIGPNDYLVTPTITLTTPVNFTLSAAVPEPATLFIYGLGLVALAAFRIRSRKS